MYNVQCAMYNWSGGGNVQLTMYNGQWAIGVVVGMGGGGG